MSRAATRKRTRPESALPAEDQAVLESIKKKQSSGISRDDIRQETRLTITALNKSLRNLTTSKLIKKIPGTQRGNETYVGIEFEPSPELTVGGLFNDGKLDLNTVKHLRDACYTIVKAKKVATPELVYQVVKSRGVVTVEVTQMFPAGTTCYRVPVASGSGGMRIGSFASIPCGACPRISLCTPDGVISPSTCVYYTKWLNF